MENDFNAFDLISGNLSRKNARKLKPRNRRWANSTSSLTSAKNKWISWKSHCKRQEAQQPQPRNLVKNWQNANSNLKRKKLINTLITLVKKITKFTEQSNNWKHQTKNRSVRPKKPNDFYSWFKCPKKSKTPKKRQSWTYNSN
jgi:hypothetical protein